MKVIQSIFIIGLLFFTFTACRKDKIPEPNDGFNCTYGEDFKTIYDTTKKTDGLMPMSFSNYWVYADTAWDAEHNVISTGVDTAWADRLQKTKGDLWWFLNGPVPFNNVHLAENKMYNLKSDYNGCLYKSFQYYEAATDTTFDSITLYGDIAVPRKVFINGSIISTPAGDFENCSVFEVDYNFAYQIIKPGVGFIKFANGDYNGGYKEYTLIDYHIEK
jgi:hypothetical protein